MNDVALQWYVSSEKGEDNGLQWPQVGGTWTGQERLHVQEMLIFEIFRCYFKDHHIFQQGGVYFNI